MIPWEKTILTKYGVGRKDYFQNNYFTKCIILTIYFSFYTGKFINNKYLFNYNMNKYRKIVKSIIVVRIPKLVRDYIFFLTNRWFEL